MWPCRPACNQVLRLFLAGALTLSAPLLCHAQGQSRGDASLRIEYQYIGTGDFSFGNEVADYWTTDSHVLLLSGDYAVLDRWTVYAALPYVQKRFNAESEIPGFSPGDPHNPNVDFVNFQPPDLRFIDDGDYHGGFQDLSFGLMYRAADGPAWAVSPYIGFGFPTHNYPFYAKAAIGARLWNLPVGVDITFIPYFSDWYFRGNLAYVFSEQPLDVNVDYWLAYLSAGYWFKPRFSVNVFASTKYIRGGLVLPWGFTDDPTYQQFEDFDNERWYQHDRLLQHRILNLGIGFDYFASEKYQLSGTYFETIWADQTNDVDTAFSIALTRYFGGD